MYILERLLISNVINFFAGICSVISVKEKNKNRIVFVEFIGTIFRIISNFIIGNWSDFLAKILKSFIQFSSLKNKLNKFRFLIISCIYILMCLIITYISSDLRCLVAIIPSIIEFYSLLSGSTIKYRFFVIVTKVLWIINNIIFKLYTSIIFDILVIIGHYFKIKKQNANKLV